jgi:hypothetical protein
MLARLGSGSHFRQRPNFTVRPGFGPAAELPAFSPEDVVTPVGVRVALLQLDRSNWRAASTSARGPRQNMQHAHLVMTNMRTDLTLTLTSHNMITE